MRLTDPETALADQNDVVTAMTGLAGLARLVRALAEAPSPAAEPPDDFVYLLLGVARLGAAVERTVAKATGLPPIVPASTSTPRAGRWLR